MTKLELGITADWVTAIASLIAAIASGWLMYHTLAAGRRARRERLEARLTTRYTREASNALKITATWEPDDQGRMVTLELEVLEPAGAFLQKRAERPDAVPGAPYEGSLDVALPEPDGDRRLSTDFRHWRNPRSEVWSTSAFVVWTEEAPLRRARAKLRIVDDASRKVLIATTIAITPMD